VGVTAWYKSLIRVDYRFSNPLDEQRARGLITVAMNTVIILAIGLVYLITDTSTSITGLSIGPVPIGVGDLALGAFLFLAIWTVYIVRLFIHRGRPDLAGIAYICFVLFVALLESILNQPATGFVLMLFSFPIILAGVLLEGRQKRIMNAVTIGVVILLAVLHLAGALEKFAPLSLSLGDMLVFVPLILLLQSNALGIFSDNQRKLLEHNLELNRKLEGNLEELATLNVRTMEATRLKSEFLATISHELRTPLNAILGFTGILLQGIRGQVDDDARRMLSRVESNSHRLLELINQVLDLSKIEAGRSELVRTSFSPRALIDQWHTQMEPLAKEKSLQFELVIDKALPETLVGDPERLTQIGVNLLGNAFKFTEQGKVNLRVECTAEDWSIIVTDTGIGIPPHALNFIFDEFRQVDGSSRRMYGGTGLGLAITRNLVRMMNGKIQVESELGKGSIFSVKLPLDGGLASQPITAVNVDKVLV
jgi:signal transduction histidine kinase